MGNQRKWSRVTPRSTRKALDRYADALMATGMDEREVARAVIYAEHKGFAALSNDTDGCVTFDEPTCGDWNCLNPDHQVVVKH